MACEFKPDLHTKIRMIQRGISDKEVKDTITKGAKTKINNNKFKSQYSIFTAIYKKYPCQIFVETVY